MNRAIAPCAKSDFEKNATRVLYFGLPFPDYRSATHAASWEEWSEMLTARGARYRELGLRALERGSLAAAVETLRSATSCFHYAQFKLAPGPRKAQLQAAVQSTYLAFAHALDPPAQAVEVLFEGSRFPGYLRTPRHPIGCVLLVNGLDSCKEVELARFAEGFLRRGFAVYYFDGPGHGQRPGDIPMSKFSPMVAAALDALSARGELAGLGFAIFGVSYGGYLACHAAASDMRLQACVSLGGFHDGRILDRLPATAYVNLRNAYALPADTAAETMKETINLGPLTDRMDRPLLVVHGTRDHLVDDAQIEALRNWPRGRPTLHVYEGAEHVCTDRFEECLPALWDWMLDRFGGPRSRHAPKLRLVDLSVTLDDLPSERVPVRTRRVLHRQGADEMSRIFGVPPTELPDGLGWAGEEFTLITHAGTHMDAPWHYGPLSGGSPAAYIDEIPLEWCVGPAVVLDVREFPRSHELSVADIRNGLARIPHALVPGEILLLRTGSDAAWGTAIYPDLGCGLGREALFWILDQGVRVVGTDAWGLDRPFDSMRDAYRRSGDAGVIWPTHYAGRERPYCQLEKLANLHLLPPVGARIMCFPIKLGQSGAAWVRAVAETPVVPKGAA